MVHRVFGVPMIIWGLVVLALAARLAVVLVLADPVEPNAMEHRSIAVSLLKGDGFAFNAAGDYTERGRYEPSSIQSPPYPLLLAGLYRTFGVESPAAHIAAMVINAIFGALTVVVIYFMVRRMAVHDHPSRAHLAGVITATLMAIWPTQLYATLGVQAVVLIVLCGVAATALWYRSVDTGRLAPWLAFGVIGCLGALTEPVLLPAMALAGVWILFHHRLKGPLRLRNAMILLACAIIIIGPWTWRNYRIHGVFMPIKSGFWVNVWKGNNATDAGHSGTDRPTLTDERLAAFSEQGIDQVRQYHLLSDADRAELDGKSTVESEAIFGRWTREFISENPDIYAATSVKRLAKTLWWDWDNPQGYQYFYLYPITRAILLIGSVIGLVLALRYRWRLGMPALIVGTALLVYTLTITAARFTVPLEPFQFALCGLVVATVALPWLSGRSQSFVPRRESPSASPVTAGG